MNIALIYGGKVSNIIVCESIELSQELFPDAICLDAEGLNIGDKYPKTNEPTVYTDNPDADRDAMLVDLEYRMTLLELGVN